MKVIKPPVRTKTQGRTLFLSGTIDQGKSKDWQSYVEESLSGFKITIFNPRRDEWDASWDQSIDNLVFTEQVNWELDQLNSSDTVLVHFEAESKSPITLLELGLMAASNRLVISCPPGYWRRGNVQVVAKRYGIPIFEKLEDAITEIKTKLT